MSRYRPVGAVVIALGLLLAACDSSGATTTTTVEVAAPTPTATAAVEAGPMPVIVDYSPTVSDVGGLMYLLAHPDVEVIAISLPATGEAGCDLGIEVTLGILAMYDREDIPVACDTEVPEGARSWPEEFLAGHENLTFGLPESTATPSNLAAPDLIAQAAAESDRPVVIYAVAPLTNVARALDRHPDLAGDLDRIVIMGGAVDAPGNTFDANAEWNVWIDVPAAADVVASGVPVTLVPLDATNFVPVPGFYQRLLDEAQQSDAIVYLSTMVRTFPQVNSGFWYFWDELAAAVAAVEDHVSTEEMTIVVVEGGTDDGRTARDDEGYSVSVAIAVPDPQGFYADFLGTLAGSPVEAGRKATAEEEAYLIAVEAATANLEAIFEAVFSDPALEAAFEGGDYDGGGVAAALELALNGVAASYEAVAGLSPPPSLQAVHDNFLEVFGMVVENKDETLTAAAQAETIEDFFANAPQFPDLNDGCAPIAAEANFLGVDVVIACNPQQ
jgi:pyrimidine-specific ribonucleoside hydrolase